MYLNTLTDTILYDKQEVLEYLTYSLFTKPENSIQHNITRIIKQLAREQNIVSAYKESFVIYFKGKAYYSNKKEHAWAHETVEVTTNYIDTLNELVTYNEKLYTEKYILEHTLISMLRVANTKEEILYLLPKSLHTFFKNIRYIPNTAMVTSDVTEYKLHLEQTTPDLDELFNSRIILNTLIQNNS